MIYFLTFGAPSKQYHHCVERLCNEAINLCCFDKITGMNEINLQKDTIFWNQHGNFINDHKKGFGYWIWKSYIIMKYLQEEMKEDDILLYMDAGCSFNKNGKLRFLEYIHLLETSQEYGIISFQMNHLSEINYTKKELFTYLQTSTKDILSGQCMATVIMIKKNKHSLFIINEWYRISSIYNLLIDNDNNNNNNNNNNNDEIHRHDQSILSLLVKKYGSIKIADETYFHPFWEKNGSLYPFWATRIRK